MSHSVFNPIPNLIDAQTEWPKQNGGPIYLCLNFWEIHLASYLLNIPSYIDIIYNRNGIAKLPFCKKGDKKK